MSLVFNTAFNAFFQCNCLILEHDRINDNDNHDRKTVLMRWKGTEIIAMKHVKAKKMLNEISNISYFTQY